MEKLAQQAISLALSGKWGEALAINLKILESSPQDTDALNRAARTYGQLGKIKEAKTFTSRVLKIDPTNKIAIRALEKWKNTGVTGGHPFSPLSPQVFLEEPGKTKIINLINRGDQKMISTLSSGDEIRLIIRKKSICVLTLSNKYLGRIPDDLSAKLRELIKHGNEYRALIKTADKNEVKIFLRETKKAEKLKDIPSFSGEKVNYIAFTPPELVRPKDESPVKVLDEEEET